MQRQLAKIYVTKNWPGKWSVVWSDKREVNSYAIVLERNGKSRIVKRYMDLGSCLQFITWAQSCPQYIKEDMIEFFKRTGG